MNQNVRAIRGLALSGVAALGLIAMTPALADSDFVTGNGAISASADVNFQVNVPRFIRFQVGSAGTTVDTVVFDVPAATMGDDGDVAATSNGTLGVALLGNVGTIDVAASTSAPLTNGVDTIDWSEILVTSDSAGLGAPAIPNTGTGAATSVTPNAGPQVVARTANWTFAYDNTSVIGAGTYTGTVTFTASAP